MKMDDSSPPELIERTCIIGVFRTTTYNMYFRCVYEYAELSVYLKNQSGTKAKDWLGFKSFVVKLKDSIGDLKKSKEPFIKGIERFYNLNNKFNLVEKSAKFVMKIPDKLSYLLKLVPDVDPKADYVSVHMREIYNPFTGFREKYIFPDVSMNNVYIRPIIFKDKSYIVFYYLSSFLDDAKSDESKKVKYGLKVSNIKSLNKAPSVQDPEAKTLANRDIELVDRELHENILSPIQIYNFTGIIDNISGLDLLSKDCQIRRSLFSKFFNIGGDKHLDRTKVNRNYNEECLEIPSNTYDVMVRVNETVTFSKMYKVSFMPQIEI